MNNLPKTPSIKRGWLRAILIIFPFLLITGFFQAIGGFFWAFISGENPMDVLQSNSNNPNLAFLIIQAFTTFGTLLIIWIFMRFIDRKKMIDLGFSFKNKTKDILYGLLAGLLMIGTGSLFLYLSGNLKFKSISFNLIGLSQSVLLLILVSVNEEVLVRGYMLRNFMDSMNRYIALFLSSLLFMALHLLNPNVSLVGMTNVFLAGILLGISYIFTKNLWFPLAFHFSWNFIQGPIFGYEVSGTNLDSLLSQNLTGSEWLTGGKFGFEGSILATILCLAGIIFFWFVYRNQNKLSEKVLS
ncbi:lysostaphin resistance A-like protein [Labilibaculum sp.]|uniref:CPBP family intramembrane glutamic endopeptidase n=1 Tax=Labilibaculum sp. TaxID=2060723 RepID=UPI003566C6EC